MVGRSVALSLLSLLCVQDPKEKLRQSLQDDCDRSWIYDDVGAGFAQAKKSGKPLMIVFR